MKSLSMWWVKEKNNMTKLFKVAKYEYTRNVFTKKFWVALLLVPLMFILFSLISAFISFRAVDKRPVGYIDKAGIITQAQKLKEKPGLFDIQIEFVPFTDEEQAKKASLAEEHQGFVIIPEDYTTSYQITWKGNKPISEEVLGNLKKYITENLIVNETIPNRARVEEGVNLRLESLDGSIKSAGASWQRIIPPVFIGILYFVLVMSSGTYLLQSLVEEKENRTIEIMLTTVSHKELMAGKILGNIGVGITQLLAWAVIVAVTLFIFRAQVPFLSELMPDPGMMAVSLVLLLISFVFTASVLAIFGATVTESQEGQQMIGIIVVPTLLPIYFLSVFMNSPNGVFAKILSFFPFSSPIAMSLRMAFTRVSTLEILLVLVVQIVFAIGAMWLAGRAFKLGMLQFSKKISLFKLFKKEAGDA